MTNASQLLAKCRDRYEPGPELEFCLGMVRATEARQKELRGS